MRSVPFFSYYFIFQILFYPLSLFSEEIGSKQDSKEPVQSIPIPDTKGVSILKEKDMKKDEQMSIKNIVDEEGSNIEQHRFFHFRNLPLAEGFANRPKDLNNERLLILGRVQLRGLSGQTESAFNNGHRDYNAVDWNFRRVRLGFMYEGASWWGMQMHLRIEDAINRPYITTQTNPTTGAVEKVNLRDNRGIVQQANLWFHIPYMDSMLLMGMFRLPFLREWNTAANMMAPERTFGHSTLHQFDLGMQYIFHPLSLVDKKYKKLILVRMSMTNGAGAGHEGTGRRAALTERRGGSQEVFLSPMYHWRVTYNPFGGFIRDGYDIGWHEGEEIFQSNQRLSIGVGGAQTRELALSASYDPLTRGVSTQTFLTPQTTPSGGTYSPTGPDYLVDNTITTPTRKDLGVTAMTYDATYTVNHFYLSGAYTRFRGSASNDTEAYNYTVGYVIPIKSIYVMPVFRYDTIEGDFNRNGRRDPTDLLRNYWIGVNLFADRHLMKFQLFYQIAQDRFGTDPYSNRPRDMDNNMVWFQVQMTFWSGTLKMEDKD
jgi:hypothetical protein